MMNSANTYKDFFQVVKPGQGGQFEVLVAWSERVLQTCHYPIGPKVSIGNKANINLPLGTMIRNFNLLESRSGQAFVNLPYESKNYLQRADGRTELKEGSYRLQQNDVVFITFRNNINLAVRFAPLTDGAKPSAPMLFTSGEYTAMLSALILTTLTGLIVSVVSPKNKTKEDFSERVAQVIFERPLIKVNPTPMPIEEIVSQPQPEPDVIIEEVKTPITQPVVEDLKGPLRQSRSDSREKNTRKPNPKIKIKPDSGSVKTTATDAANLQSQTIDPLKMGLMSALNTDGIRKKMDQVYNGTGQLIGVGENATGSSGSRESRSGDDFGAKFRNTGEGGKGAATVGISKIKINQRGTEKGIQSSPQEFGVKEQTGIVVGGDEEGFIGTIDKAAVRKAVRSHLPAIKACYERQYKTNTQLEGKVVIAWEIHKEGLAKRTRVVETQSTINNQSVENCVRAVIETIRFPEPPQGALVEVTGFPFVFSGMK